MAASAPPALIPIQNLIKNGPYLDKFNAYVCPYNNYYNYSNQELDLILGYKRYISGWLSFVIIVVGIAANSVTICALLYRCMRRSSTNAYLLALSLSNLISLTCLLLMTALRFTLVYPYRLNYCKHWYENWISQCIPYLTPINNMFQLSGIYLIIAVSIDRLVIIRIHARPTDASRRKRRTITWIIIGAIFAFCFLFTAPNWFLYKTTMVEMSVNKSELLRSIEDNFAKLEAPFAPLDLHALRKDYNQSIDESFVYNIKHFRVEHTKFGQNNMVKSVISVFMYIPFVFFIPISVLLIVNFLIIYELFKISGR
jgi:hypothetical protein